MVLAFGVSFQACEPVSYPLAADLLLRECWGIVTKCNVRYVYSVYSVCVTAGRFRSGSRHVIMVSLARPVRTCCHSFYVGDGCHGRGIFRCC